MKQKWPGYYAERRPEIVAELPLPLGDVLDVGCGAGAVGEDLRAAGAQRMVGIEVDADAASLAAAVYDQVLEGQVEAHLDQMDGGFDTVVCYDVLEHLVDPWSVLAALRELAVPGAHLHVSVPNARHPALALGLLFRGTFGYELAGLRDITHLRWFTRRDIRSAVEEAGWHVLAEGHNPISPARRAVKRLTRDRATEFMVGQLSVLARRPG